MTAALKWGMTRIADADDVMLAMVSPHAYWLLREWRRRAFGDQEAMRGMLEDAKRQLTRLGASDAALRGASISVRTKGLFSTFHKAVVRQQHVHDVLAVRVVVKGGLDDEVFSAHESIRRLWPSEEGRYKDYVARPKANGYKALHDTMVLPSGHAFEVQVRSRAMHLEAEHGTAAHRRYKGALCRLPMAVMSGVALVPSSSGVVQLQRMVPLPWPLAGDTTLSLAARLAA